MCLDTALGHWGLGDQPKEGVLMCIGLGMHSFWTVASKPQSLYHFLRVHADDLIYVQYTFNYIHTYM